MQVNGKEFGVKYNMYAQEQYSSIKGTGKAMIANIMALMWIGYLGWCYVKQIEPEFTFEEVSDFVESADENPEVIKLIAYCTDAYKESKLYERLIKKADPVEKKSEETNGNMDGMTSINMPGEKSDLNQENIMS